jgi:hypothetical protein
MTLATFGLIVLTLLCGFIPGLLLGAFITSLIRDLE